ncbi:CdaR family protein [Deferribacter abyssi]|uniref:CdaR family protein n=1 Tax=Deferribacter abyssi TaxID=213806 RepID=UPI003C233AC9
MFLKNIELKIISVLLALFLWFIVVTSDYQEFTFDVPIVLDNLNKGLIAVYDTNIIRVTLKGPSYLLKTISYNDVRIKIDASVLRYGKNRYTISFNDVLTPKGLEVVKVEPKFITITIDEMIEKKVKVVPVFIGSPKIGFKIKKVRILPNIVTVKGAKKSINNIKLIETLPIDITNRYRDLTYNISVKKETGIRKITPPNVEVYIEFTEDIVTKTVELPVVVIGKRNFKVKLLNEKVKVKLKGRKDVIDDEKIKNTVRFFIDVSDVLEPGRYLKEVQYNNAKKVEVLKIIPDKVRVEVIK